MNTLKSALLANSISSFLTGTALILFQVFFMNLFNVQNTTVFLILGIALLFFSGTVFIEIKKQRALAILWIIIQDSIWVIASIAILIWRPFDISDAGYLLIDIMAFLVLTFAIFQSIGLSRIDTAKGSKIKILSFRRTVSADKRKVWKVISDIKNYHKVASNIDNVKIITGEGEGLVRQCSHGKDSWKETCTLWEEEKQYSFVVDTSAPDYPYPFKSLKGSWQVNEINSFELRKDVF
jgi:ribosome-associated toxin RatA of RatAB toxin-antitoxin module